ncbi:MAG: hypothetical protein R6V17_05855 [Halanaerobacter sp.]
MSQFGSPDPSLAMFFRVTLSIHNYGYEKDGNTPHPEWRCAFYRDISIIITARYRVFVAIDDAKPTEERIDPGKFQNTSNHDSCWKSDGLACIWQTIMQGYDFCFAHVPKEHRPIPSEMPLHLGLGRTPFFYDPISFVRVEFEGEKGLKSIKPLKFKIEIQDEEES